MSKLLNTITTMTRILSVFGCAGNTFHVVSGLALLRAMNGYVCPYCGAEVHDITDTPVGRYYHAFHRPDLPHPAKKTS